MWHLSLFSMTRVNTIAPDKGLFPTEKKKKKKKKIFLVENKKMSVFLMENIYCDTLLINPSQHIFSLKNKENMWRPLLSGAMQYYIYPKYSDRFA